MAGEWCARAVESPHPLAAAARAGGLSVPTDPIPLVASVAKAELVGTIRRRMRIEERWEAEGSIGQPAPVTFRALRRVRGWEYRLSGVLVLLGGLDLAEHEREFGGGLDHA